MKSSDMLLVWLFLLVLRARAFPSENPEETDNEESRKILGSSVVTSVSVILNTANGTQIIDAVGKPVPRPPTGTYVASPINLLNPDRYEFFTFDDNGELVKRLMTLQEIQSIIANGDGEDLNYDTGNYLPEKKVDDVVSNVQSVLKEQIASHKNVTDVKPVLDTPDVTSTWSMILPAIFSNNAEGIAAEKPVMAVTADTIVVEDLLTDFVTTERYTPIITKFATTVSEIVSTTTPTTMTTPVPATTTTTTTPAPTTTTTTTTTPAPTPPRTTPTPSTTTTTPSTTIRTTPVPPSTTTTTTPRTTPTPSTTTTTTTTPTPFTTSRTTPTPFTTTKTAPTLSTTIRTTLTPSTTIRTTPTPSTTIVTTHTPSTTIRTTPTPFTTIRTTPASSTTTTTTSAPSTIPPTIALPTTLMPEGLITEQHVDTTTKPPILEDTKETTSSTVEDDDVITVTIVSDTRYDTSTLPVGGDSPIVSISPIQVKTSTESSSSENVFVGASSSISSILSDSHDVKVTAAPVLTTTMGPVRIQPYAPISQPIQAPVYVVHKESVSSTDVPPTAQNPVVEDEITTIKDEISSEEVPQLDNETTQTEEADESSSELIDTSASSSLGHSNLKSTTPILLIIKENPVTEKIQSESLSSERPLFENKPSESALPTEEQFQKTTESPFKVTDKSSTIKIIYLTEKTVASILSSTNQPSSTTPKSASTIPEEITTITKLIATTETPNTIKIIPLTEKLITTINSISSPTVTPTTAKEEVQTTEAIEEEEEVITDSTTETTIYNKAVTESLNQLLLTSTNIYEINTQLAGDAGMDATAEAILDLDDDLETQSDTTTESYTTELSLMSSIQQLISQTVDNTNVEKQILNLESNQKVADFLANMDTKPMMDVQSEAATIGSAVLLGDNNGETTTEEDSTDANTTESEESLKLSEAVSSVLSQIYSQSQNLASEADKIIDKNENAKNGSSLETETIAAESSQKIITEITGNDQELMKEDAEGSLKQNEDVAPEEMSKNETLSVEESTELDHQMKDEEIEKTTVVATTQKAVVKNKYKEKEDIPNVIKIVLLNSEKPNKRRRKPLRTTTQIPIEESVKNEDKTEEVGIGVTEMPQNEMLAHTTVAAASVQQVGDNKEEQVVDKIGIKTDDPIADTKVAAQNADSTKVNISNEYKVEANVESTTKIEEIAPSFEEKLKPSQSIEASTVFSTLKEDFDVSTTSQEETTSSTETSVVFVEISSQSVNNSEKTEETQQPVKKIKIDDVIQGEETKIAFPETTPSNPPSTSDIEQPLKVDSIEDDVKNTSWTLVSTILPHTNSSAQEEPASVVITTTTTTQIPVKLSQQSVAGFGLDDTTSKLDTDIYQFVELCNELSFGFWNAVTHGISTARSVFVSPFAATSLLAMVFLGARGATSGEMNEILKLDDMVTFNPHLIFKNVTESVEVLQTTGVAVSVIARELYSDRGRGKLLGFYKERAKQFYDGHVEEINFKEVGDVVRRRTNLIVKKNSFGKIPEYLKDNSITVRPPLAGISASIFQTDCSSASTEGRDGELHFVVLPSIRQRRLVPVPAVVFRNGFLAGYDPTLDATAAAIGTQEQIVSTIFVIPGQQGIAAPGDGLARLERQLTEGAFKKGAWTRLLRTLIPRPGLELQIPRFSHKSVINATVALQRMGLKDLFHYGKADLRGLNGAAHELHLSDILQLNNFATCGESPINFEQHHSEIYPATSRRPYRRTRKLGHYISDSVFSDIIDEPRDYQRAFHDPLHDPSLLSLPLPLRPRQARIPDAPRLRFDRPFLFYVRHNPTGLILHMGRFNPRLLP